MLTSPQSEPIRNDAGAAGMGAPAVGTSPAMGFPGGGNTYIPSTGRKRETIGLTRMAYQDTEGNPLLYTTDAAGHEHKGAGPGGGQFTGHGGGAETHRLVGPESAPGQPPKANNSPSEANTQVASEHHATAASLVSKSPHLSEEKAAQYTKTLASAFEKMSPTAREAVNKVIKYGGTANFHNTPQDLTKAVEKQTGKKERSILSGAVVNDRTHHHLHLDGDNGTDKAEGVYLHELAHMIDDDHIHSDNPAWKTAWKREIFNPKAGARVIKYARINEAEGFAEIHRLITTEGVDSARQHWPKCVKYFEDKGLVK